VISGEPKIVVRGFNRKELKELREGGFFEQEIAERTEGDKMLF